MGDTPQHLTTHIRETRDELGRNIEQLQSQVRRTFDWRVQFHDRPWVGVGIAFGAGFLGAMLMNRRHPYRSTFNEEAPIRQVSETWTQVKTALLSAATAKLVDYFRQMVPGFSEHYKGSHTSTRDPVVH
jgi:hypothetical protein